MASREQQTQNVVKKGPCQCQEFGANGTLPQTAVTANATVAGGTGTAAGGFDTAGNRDAFIALVNQIRSTLIACGIMA
jgi:hypothetical protein